MTKRLAVPELAYKCGGAMFNAGPMYIYTDAAFGYSQPWLGPEWENAFTSGTPDDMDWHMRFNINFEYHF